MRLFRRRKPAPQPLDDRDELLLRAILDHLNGDVVCIVQSAAEQTGTLYDRLSKAYHEITGTDGNPDEEIRLR